MLEQERAGNIARNKQALEAFMAQEAAAAAAAAAGEGEHAAMGSAAPLDPPTPAGAGAALVAKPGKSVGSLTSTEAGAPAKRGTKKVGHKRARPPAAAAAAGNDSGQQAAAAQDAAKDAVAAAAVVTDDEWQRTLAFVAKRQAAGAAEAKIRAQAAVLQSTKGAASSKKARKVGSGSNGQGAGAAPAADV